MSMREDSGPPEPELRMVPFLVGQLCLGMVIFAAAAVYFGPGGPGAGGAGGGAGGGGTASAAQVSQVALLGSLAVMCVGCYGTFAMVGGQARIRAAREWERRENDEAGRAALVRVVLVTTIIRAALAEAPGLFAGAIILISGGLLPLVSVGLSVVLLVLLMPAKARLLKLEEAATGARVVGYRGEGG